MDNGLNRPSCTDPGVAALVPESFDPLTRLRSAKALWREFASLKKTGAGDCFLVLIDVNGLKLINQVYGYEKGSLALLEVSDVLKNIFSGRSQLYRGGEDDFIALYRGDSLKALERLGSGITEFSARAQKNVPPISLSWGACCLYEAGGLEETIRVAKDRMINHKLMQKQSVRHQIIAPLKQALRARTTETAQHMERMRSLAGELGERLGLPTHELDKLALLSSMHDIGKLGIPDSILKKPGPLTAEEWQVMRGHCEAGYGIAMSAPELFPIAEYILCHHEWWDGSGYPAGKRAEQIPLLSRILSLVDAYDVMTHDRAYKKAISHKRALAEISRFKGRQFSPDIAELFIAAFKALPPKPSGEAGRIF